MYSQSCTSSIAVCIVAGHADGTPQHTTTTHTTHTHTTPPPRMTQASASQAPWLNLNEDLSLQVLLDPHLLHHTIGHTIPIGLRFAVPLFGSQLTSTMQRALRMLSARVASLSFAPGECGGRKVCVWMGGVVCGCGCLGGQCVGIMMMVVMQCRVYGGATHTHTHTLTHTQTHTHTKQQHRSSNPHHGPPTPPTSSTSITSSWPPMTCGSPPISPPSHVSPSSPTPPRLPSPPRGPGPSIWCT